MKKINVLFLAVVLAALLPLHATAAGDKIKIKPKNLPETIIKAFKSAYPNAKIKSAHLIKKDGSYKIRSLDGKTKRYLLYAADGSVLETEESMDPNLLPDPVRETIKKDYPGMRVRRAAKVIKDNTVGYEISVSSGMKKKGVIFVTKKSGAKEKIMMDEKGNVQKKE